MSTISPRAEVVFGVNEAFDAIIESEKLKAARKWLRSWRGRLAKTALVFFAGVIVGSFATGCIRDRIDERRAEAEAQAAYAASVENVQEEPAATNGIDPLYVTEAEAISRVLYPVRDNSETDLRTYIWCIFNRVDNSSREFQNTLQDVIDAPGQWMGYLPSNPVLEDLYQIAVEEVVVWHEGHRPVTDDFVFAEWSPKEIVLRNTWDYTRETKTWRYGE